MSPSDPDLKTGGESQDDSSPDSNGNFNNPAPTSGIGSPSSSVDGVSAAGGSGVGQPPTSPLTSDPTVGGAALGSFSGVQSSDQPAPKKNRLKKMMLPIALLIVLVGGSAGAYFGVVAPNEPKNILKSALVNMINGDLKSANFNGTISETQKGSSQPIDITLSGVENQTGEVDLSASVDAVVTTFGLEVRSADGKTAYVKLSGLDSVVTLLNSLGSSSSLASPQVVGLLKAVNNQWYQINPSLLGSVEKSLKISPSASASQDNSKAISKLYSENSFLTVQKVLPNQTIAGQNSYHAKVVVDSTKLKAFLSAANSQHLTGSTIPQQVLAAVLKNLSTSSSSSAPFDIWVTKSGHFIDQTTLSTSDSTGTTDVTLTLSKINQPISVQVPANAQSVLDLISQVTQLFGGGTGGTTVNPLDLLNLSSGAPSSTQSL